ncbi:MAG: site-specific integrase, partial [Desulfotomaculum sp.]|nr:site-specific integrase [Desulfotomaculum sp.]
MPSYTGHVEKRYKSSYTIIIEGERVGGKRRRITKSVKVKNKKEAEKIMIEMIAELNKGTYIENSSMTFAEFLERWLKDYAEPKLSPKTYLRYHEIITKKVIPELGSIKLVSLKPVHLQQYYNKLLAGGRQDGKKGGLSPSTVLHHHRIIHKALNTAVKWQLLAKNAADAVDPPKKTRHEIEVLDEKQVKAMLEAAKGTSYY